MRKRKQHTTNLAKASVLERDRAPLIDHLQELKRRLFFVVVSIAIGSGIAYGIEQHLITALLHPSHGQHFIYTSPMGGINFLFSVCIYVGVAVSLPVIVFNFLQFIKPLMRDTTARFIFTASAVSGLIALAGLTFGYFVGLPAALQLLLHQFHSTQIQALITIQAYMSFVTAYLFGSALMFQLPLFLVFINRIKPLKPSQLFKYERLVIIFAVIIGFIMNPSPNLISQGMVVIPIILMYQVGIGLVWFLNRGGRGDKFLVMINEEAARRAERAAQATQLLPVLDAEPEAELQRPRPWLELSDADTLAQPQPATIAEPVAEAEAEAVEVPAPAPIVRIMPRGQYDVSPSVSLASTLNAPSANYQRISVRLAD